ncbi:nuclear receptor corepressor 2-like [Amphibalanus amphitrite]|uniref:nuclear receptor corepressor 2-like n=1 Tax=Amphibalanus amphitrite TaxID=1232801 RepID=UPI001C8FAF24|nr:nuclear receptor corepressor 2-like [Amphibalanus amphitrite]
MVRRGDAARGYSAASPSLWQQQQQEVAAAAHLAQPTYLPMEYSMVRPALYASHRPAGHEASPYQPAASAAISPPMSQGRLPYSSGASGVYHPAGVVVTAPGPAPSHHDVRWQQAVAAAAAAAAAPSPYSVRNTPVCLTVSAPLLGPQMQLARLDGERDRVDRLAVPRMHLHDPHAAAAAEIYERQRYKHLEGGYGERDVVPHLAGLPGAPSSAAAAAAAAAAAHHPHHHPAAAAKLRLLDRDRETKPPPQPPPPPEVRGGGGGGLTVSSASDVRLPLHIVTSGEAGAPHSMVTAQRESYNPQTEAISPTLPADGLDESPLRSTKDELLGQISTIDREIMKAESQIAKLKRKQSELEDQASKPDGPAEDEDEKENKNRSLAQIIYAENRKKARLAKADLEKLGPPAPSEEQSSDGGSARLFTSSQPLYNQPSDTDIYQANQAAFKALKPSLVSYVRRRRQRQESRARAVVDAYTEKMTVWMRQIERLESLPKNRQKAAKNRDFYEKVFPEIKKAREERERFNRVGRMIKSDAEMEEVMDGIQEQENEKQKMKSLAVIPPPLLDESRRKYVFHSTDGLIQDPMAVHKEVPNYNVWTEAEREAFRERYMQHPKLFHMISAAIEGKTTSECVNYYYMSKKQEKYKERLKKARTRGRNRGLPKPAAPLPPVEVIGANVQGVTTRGSMAALQQREKAGGATAAPGAAVSSIVSDSVPDESAPPAPAAAAAAAPSEKPTAAAAAPTPPPVSVPASAAAAAAAPPPATNATGDQTTSSASETKAGKKRERRKGEEERRKAVVSSDDENENTGKGGPHPCAVCQAQLEHFGQSRPLPASHASIYGLSEQGVPEQARVCTSCRCRSVKRRYSHVKCPIPTCPTPKFRVKRLRPLPARWTEIAPETRQAIALELQITPEVVKCCSACHNRIARKLTPGEPAEEPSQWSEAEIERLRSGLRTLGPDWQRLAETVGGRSASQCKRFYIDHKLKHKLDEVMAEYKRLTGDKEGHVVVTDEEESGSSTSSADDPESRAAAAAAAAAAGAATNSTGAVPAPAAAEPAQRKDSESTTSAPSPFAPTTNGTPNGELPPGGDDLVPAGASAASLAARQAHQTPSPAPPAASGAAGSVPPTVTVNNNDKGDSSATVSADEATNDADDKAEPKFLGARAGTPASTMSVSPRPTLANCNKVLMGDLIDDTINMSFRGLCKDRELAQGPGALSAPSLTIKSLLGGQEPCVSPLAMTRPAAVLSRADSNEVQDLSVRKPAAPPASSSAPVGLKRPLEHRPGQSGPPPPPAHRPAMVPRGVPDPHRLEPPRDTYYSPDMRIRSPSQPPVFMTDPRAALAPPPHVMAAPRPASPAPRGLPPKPAGLKPAPPPLTSSRAGPPPGPPPAHMPGRPDPKTSPISVRTGSGSITQGTPLANIPHVAPYEGLLRPMAPQQPPPHQTAQKKGGSITQGTPLQPDQKRAAPPQLKEHPTTGYDSRGVLVVVQDGMRPGASYDGRVPPEHYKAAARMSPGGHPGYPPYAPGAVSAAYHHHAAQHQQAAPRQPAPSPHDQLSSRHVLLNDYITSQQMMGRRDSRGGPPEVKSEPRSTPGLDGQPPPPSPQQQSLYFPQPPAGYPPVSSYMRHQAAAAAAAAAARDTPPPHQQHHHAPPPHQPPPQRQGVIQRPTASRPPSKAGPSVPAPHDSYHKPSAASQYGQDVNFSTLVDVAVAQSSLMVPGREEQLQREMAARYGRPPSSHEQQLRGTYALTKEAMGQAQAQALRGGRPLGEDKITTMSLIDTIINRSINQVESGGQPVSSAADHPADLRASPYKVSRSPAAKDVLLLEQQNDKRASPRGPPMEPPSSHEDSRPARSTPLSLAVSRPGPLYAAPGGRPPQQPYHSLEPHAARMAMLQMPRSSASSLSPMAYQGRPMAPPGHRPQHLSPGGAGGGPSASPQMPSAQDYPYRYRKALPPRQPEPPPQSPAEAERARYRAEERHIIRVAQSGSPERANHRPPASQGYLPPPPPRRETVTPPGGPGDRPDGMGDPSKLSAAQQQALWLQQQQQQQQQHQRRSAYMEPTSRASIASPLDYVKYRIAEAMRTPDTAGGEGGEQKERPASRGTVRPHSPHTTYEPVKRARLTPDAGPPSDGKPPSAEQKAAEQAAERAEAEAASAEHLKRAMAAGYYPYQTPNGGLPPGSTAGDGERGGQHIGNSSYQDISDDD